MKELTLHKQHGFALIDVLIATIVLSIGAIAFVKLSNVSINRAKESDFTSLATSSANALIELARSNSRFIMDIQNRHNKSVLIAKRNIIEGRVEKCSGTSVHANNKTTWCAHDSTDLLDDLYNKLQAEFSKNFDYAEGRAVACLNVAPITTERPFDVRVTVIWKLATEGTSGPVFNPATRADCPTSYTAPIQNTADTIDSDRAYFEIYTRI